MHKAKAQTQSPLHKRDRHKVKAKKYYNLGDPMITNNKIYFEVRVTVYVPAFTQKDFHYVHTGPSTKEPSLRNYNFTLGVHYSSLKYNHLYTRGTRHKAKTQSP